MTEILRCGTSDLAKHERLIVLDRPQILLSYLKEGMSLAHVAQEQKLIPLLLNRWAADYRRLGTRRHSLKLDADKEKRRTLPTIQQLLRSLAMPNLGQAIPTVTEVECESLVVGAA